MKVFALLSDFPLKTFQLKFQLPFEDQRFRIDRPAHLDVGESLSFICRSPDASSTLRNDAGSTLLNDAKSKVPNDANSKVRNNANSKLLTDASCCVKRRDFGSKSSQNLVFLHFFCFKP